jgi:hypothetical protein
MTVCSNSGQSWPTERLPYSISSSSTAASKASRKIKLRRIRSRPPAAGVARVTPPAAGATPPASGAAPPAAGAARAAPPAAGAARAAPSRRRRRPCRSQLPPPPPACRDRHRRPLSRLRAVVREVGGEIFLGFGWPSFCLTGGGGGGVGWLRQVGIGDPAGGKWAPTKRQVATVPPYDHWDPRARGPPVSDLNAETVGTKKSTVAFRKKSRPRIDGRDRSEGAIQRPIMANRCGAPLAIHQLYL